MVAGVPLAICANCVAPIGRSLFVAGASPNTVLATMISSPTLNVVVLAMVFALFPLPIALVRIVVPLVLLALVPVIVRKTAPAAWISRTGNTSLVDKNGWWQPLGFTLKSYLKNFAGLTVATVPLMVVAASLGALIVEVLPVNHIPTTVSLVGVVAVASAGTFVPVPMAFDVAIAFLLMTRGVPTPYVVTLRCTWGAFSLYPMLILGRTISWRTATALFGSVMLLGIAAGYGVNPARPLT